MDAADTASAATENDVLAQAQVPATPAADGAACQTVGPVPDEVRTRLRLDAFYTKYIDANGLPVLSSAKPDDRALKLACVLLNDVLRKRDDVRQALIRNRARFAIIGRNEGTAEIPEYGYRNRPQADIDYINRRARGMAGIVASCGEENILCLPGDRYYNESICLHEFAHTIAMYGIYSADRTFQTRLRESYNSAKTSGILEGTYRKENEQEYWAEGAQDWYDTNATARPTNGVHNQIHLKTQLATYDPKLYALLKESFPEDRNWPDCRAAKKP
ncbi:MAG: hypothetical protein ABW252_23100 [Polyangiales bacterium]